jgi:hypothetical protein
VQFAQHRRAERMRRQANHFLFADKHRVVHSGIPLQGFEYRRCDDGL